MNGRHQIMAMEDDRSRIIREGELKVDSEKCMGCGVCVATCPTEAIEMKKR